MIDSGDAGGLSRLFGEQGRRRFAGSDPVVGPEAIEAGVRSIFGTIKSLRQTVVRECSSGHDSIVTSDAIYLDDEPPPDGLPAIPPSAYA